MAAAVVVVSNDLTRVLCCRFVHGTVQVETERVEVLRLSAALDDLRSTAHQDMLAAQDKETALKALLASETEVSGGFAFGVESFLGREECTAVHVPRVHQGRGVFVGLQEYVVCLNCRCWS